MKKFNVAVSMLALLAGSSVMLLSGCGGGASSETTVTIKPSTTEDSGSDSSANGGDSGGSAPAAAEGFGTLTGVVSFDGAQPFLEALVEKGKQGVDAICASEGVPGETIIVNNGKLANVCIYLARAPRGMSVPPPPEETAVFDQKLCKFLPHVLFVRTGQPLQILNGDPVLHNTHTYPAKDKPFNSTIPPNDRTGKTIQYARADPTPVEVKCDIHAWMRAYHLVVDHPFAAISGEDGTFRIEGLPAGEHEFRIWHETAGYLERKYKVTITADQETAVELSYGSAELSRWDGPKSKKVILSALP
jgi:hypothetical protein